MKPYLKNEAYNVNFHKHHLKIWHHMLVCGATGSGKTNFFANYLSQMGAVYEHIYIFTKNISEEAYLMLKDSYGDALTLGVIDSLPTIEHLIKIKKFDQALIVFDDFICCDNKIMEKMGNYITFGRKEGFTLMWLAQYYYKVPIVVRNNVTYLTLLSLATKRNLDMIIQQFSVDVDKTIIKKIIKNATKNKFNICIINLFEELDYNIVFRRNFNDFYQLVDEDGEDLNKIEMFSGNGLLN